MIKYFVLLMTFASFISACTLSQNAELSATTPTVEIQVTATSEPEPTAEQSDTTENTSGEQSEQTDTSQCSPRTDWQFTYTVDPGITLSFIAQASNTTVAEIVAGNCLPDANTIYEGQVLRLPNQPIIGDGPGAGPPPNDNNPDIQISEVRIEPSTNTGYTGLGPTQYEITAGTTVTLTWINPPAGTTTIEWQYRTETKQATIIATGQSATWTVPTGINGLIMARNADGLESPGIQVFTK